jgi:hypothetical protein
MEKPKVLPGKTTNNFRVWHKSVKTYSWYENQNFTANTDTIDGLQSELKGNALI